MYYEADDNSYGDKKRIHFLHEEIKKRSPKTILDIGCGTGIAVSRPLSLLHPEVNFTCIEDDAKTLAFAQSHNRDLANCQFLKEIPADKKFDLVIASEVLEHVSDPESFLKALRTKLSLGGVLLLTLPNGYGISEWVTLLQYVLRYVKRRLFASKPSSQTIGCTEADTLAYSPHIQFFTFQELQKLLQKNGFSIQKYRGRMVACGFIVSPIIERLAFLRAWNLKMADIFPAALVSDWMLVCSPEREDTQLKLNRGWFQNRYSSFKRYLNLHPLLR